MRLSSCSFTHVDIAEILDPMYTPLVTFSSLPQEFQFRWNFSVTILENGEEKNEVSLLLDSDADRNVSIAECRIEICFRKSIYI
jgi:hypothetical protein